MKIVGVLLASLMTLTLSATPSTAVAPRIVGGSPIGISQVPWHVAISSGGSLCGGSLINVDWVVTAAHCVSGVAPSSISVFSGIDQLSQRTTENRSTASNVVIHPDWNGSIFNADIALIQLSSPVTLSANVQLIDLPSGVDPSVWPAQGTPATIAGWGATFFNGAVSNQLLGATISILAGPEANSCGRYGSSYQAIDDICAGLPTGGIDTCQGDSGGSLVVSNAGKPVLAGVTSVGNECALANFPGIYTRVTTYASWIRGIVPLPITAPAIPAGLVAQPGQNGRVFVQWQPVTDLGNDSSVTYTLSLLSADSSLTQLCSTQDPQCLVTNLKIGKPASLVVQARNSREASPVSGPVVTVPVNTVRVVGKVITKTKVATLAGLTLNQARNVSLKVRVASRDNCVVTKIGVRMKSLGLCVVGVQSTQKKTVRGTTYILIR